MQIQWIGEHTLNMVVVAMAITIIKLAWYALLKGKKYMDYISLENVSMYMVTDKTSLLTLYMTQGQDSGSVTITSETIQ